MQLNFFKTAGNMLLKLKWMGVFILLSAGVFAQTFTVTSTADSDPFSLVSGTLRWAITQANAATGPSTIAFNISGTAPQVLTISGSYGALPALNNAHGQSITINGSTQPANGYTGIEPKIVLDGSNLGGGNLATCVLILDGNGGYVIQNISIQNIPDCGIRIFSPNVQILNNTFYGINVAEQSFGGATFIDIESSNNDVIENNNIGTNFQNNLTTSSNAVGISIDPATSEAVSNVLIKDNICENITFGIERSIGDNGTITNVRITQNLLYNLESAIVDVPSPLYPLPYIIQYSGGIISGIAQANDFIEIFGTSVLGMAQAYLGSVTAGSDGTWSLNIGSQSWAAFSATATKNPGSVPSGDQPITSPLNSSPPPCPSAPTVSSNSPLCTGQTLNLTTPTLSGATYNWTGPNGFTSSAQNPTITNVSTLASGTYFVTVSLNGCTSSPGTTTVTINSFPMVTINPSLPGCTNGIISTVVGNGTQGYSGDGGAATSAELAGPWTVAVDGTGNVYIADIDNNRIRKFTAVTGIISTFAGNGTAGFSGDGGAATSAELNNPLGIAVDAAGNVYIADQGNYRVRKVSATTGDISTIAGNGTQGYSGDGGAATSAELSNPAGVAVDAAGNVYIADESNNVIRKITSSGIISTFAGNGTFGFSGDGAAATLAEIADPTAVAVDGAGNVYIADIENQRIRVVTTNGIISTFAGNGTAGYAGDGGPAVSAELTDPEGVAVDGSGNVYIADAFGSRVRIVSNGIISTLAGNGNFGYTGDGGPAVAAALDVPTGMAADGSGNVYIADLGNNVIRKVVCGAANGSVSANAATVCKGSSVTLSATGGASYHWSTGATTGSIAVTPLSTTSYTVTASTNGCSSVTTATVTVNQGPVVEVSAGTSVCVGGSIYLTASNLSGATYSWTGPNSYSSSLQNPEIDYVTAAAAGSYSLTVNVSTGLCTSSVYTTSVTINTCNQQCSIVGEVQDPKIRLISPPNVSKAYTTSILQYSINEVPQLVGGVTNYTLVLQVAPEQIDPVTGVRTANWSLAQGFNTVSATLSTGTYTVALASYVPASNIPVNYYWRVGIEYQPKDNSGHQPVLWSPVFKFILHPFDPAVPSACITGDPQSTNINWVYGVSYLDNGLTSEGIAYIDGLGKSRQVQSKQNSTNTILAVEAVYSDEGGGTVMSLPAPISANGSCQFGYANRFMDVFDGTNWSDFSTKDFDREIKGAVQNTLVTPTAVDQTIAGGVGNYYSANNTNAYVDAANGYPYAYNVGEKSPLQRPILTAAGVGSDFKITSGKENQRFYPPAAQQELDRVFGVAAAPLAANVAESITIDPDGVGHISYTDNEGKLIATALTTCNLPSLKPLNEEGMDGFTVNLNPLGNDQMDPIDLSRTATSKFYIGCTATPVTINYNIQLSSFQLDAEAPCASCAYDVTVSITNDQTSQVVYNNTQALVPSQNTCPNNPQQVNIINETVSLTGPGTFTIHRVIAPYTNTVTGQNILTSTLNSYLQSLTTNRSQLFSAFETAYNTESFYFLLRQEITAPTATTFTNTPCEATISTYAGTGGTQQSCPDKDELVLNGPAGITKDDLGNFYIAESGNNVIRELTPTGVVYTLAGTKGQAGFTDGTAALFNAPSDVVFRPYTGIGNDQYPASIIVADKNNNAIRMVSVATGSVTTLAGVTQGISSPEGLGIDAYGVIYVASTGNAKVYSINLSSGSPVVTQLFSSYTFNQPSDIAVGASGECYVTDQGANTLLEFPSTTAGVTPITLVSAATMSNFTQPRSVTYADSALLYVSSFNNNLLFAVDPVSTTATVIAGSSSGLVDGVGTAAKFDGPQGLYNDGTSELYIADFVNNRIRKAYIIACISTNTVSGGYQWYADRTSLTGVSGPALYTQSLGQLSGNQHGFPGTEQYLLTGTTLQGPASSAIMSDFIAGYQLLNGVDLTGKITAMNVYGINAGSQVGSTVAAIDVNDTIYPHNQQTCYLLYVTYTQQGCAQACAGNTYALPCNQQCQEQQMALLEHVNYDHDSLLTQGTGSYGNPAMTLQQLVDNNYPLSPIWYGQLTGNDTALYDTYDDDRQAFEQFSVSGCLSLCNGGNPGPCATCDPDYGSCVFSNMDSLINGFTYLTNTWDAQGGTTFPFVYTDLIHMDSQGNPYPDAQLSESLSVELLNFIATSLQNGSNPDTVRSNWNPQGGACSNCQAPATANPTCPADAPRDMSQFPTILLPVLQSMNQTCLQNYNGCLQLNGTPTQERDYLCTQQMNTSIQNLGPEPQPANSSNAAWVTYQSQLTAIQSNYTACTNPATPPGLNDPIIKQRMESIEQTLMPLYPLPSDSTLIQTLTAQIMAQTATLSSTQLQMYLTNYADTATCIKNCQQQLMNAFNSYISQLEQNAKDSIRNGFINGCYGTMQEQLQLSFTESAYHYTLYNYDRANNLVNTIPPAGIDYIDLTDPNQYTASPRSSRVPQHRMLSTYRPSSLYTIEATSPDEGATRYLYDVAGRLRFSQTAEQRARENQLGSKIFSYVVYDNDSRVIESGEYHDGLVFNGQTMHVYSQWAPKFYTETYAYQSFLPSVADGLQIPDFPSSTWAPASTFEETYVEYDHPTLPANLTLSGNEGPQTYLDGRVSKTYNRDATTNAISSTTHYSYDAHGRVNFVVQELPVFTSAAVTAGAPTANFQYKTVDYVYQNLTSRIDQIIYQKGNPQEEFRQKYTYDSDYRIIGAEVSRDGGNTWLPTSNYQYYVHGPLQSTALGNNIQQMDYAYNINGWLKSINTPIPGSYPNTANESTSNPGSNFAPDVFSEAVNYYNGDYKRTGVGLDKTTLSVPQAGTQLAANSLDLFSGNISSTITNTAFNLTSMTNPQGNILAQGYTYDVLNRLTDVYAEVQPNNLMAFANTGAGTTNYASHITYDANGNIQTLLRNTLMRSITVGGTPTNAMDNLTYNYPNTTTNQYHPGKVYITNNQLALVNDAVTSEATLDDIKDQDIPGNPYNPTNTNTYNYNYDAKGRITSDLASGLTSIQWTVSDKIKSITKADGSQLQFTYNAQQQRLTKTVIPAPTGGTNVTQGTVTTIYTYDANGILMATYQQSYDNTSQLIQTSLEEHQMYGMGRVGVYNVDEILVPSPTQAANDASKQFFEITDHLGSVRAVVSGVKQTTGTLAGNATVMSLTDYHEFGYGMNGRSFVSSTGYRFGYQGSEKDKEADGGLYTTEFRALDVRLGRWFMPDPIIHSSWSPYVSMNDNPIALVDQMGLSSGSVEADPNINGYEAPEGGTSVLGPNGECYSCGGAPSGSSGTSTSGGGTETTQTGTQSNPAEMFSSGDTFEGGNTGGQADQPSTQSPSSSSGQNYKSAGLSPSVDNGNAAHNAFTDYWRRNDPNQIYWRANRNLNGNIDRSRPDLIYYNGQVGGVWELKPASPSPSSDKAAPEASWYVKGLNARYGEGKFGPGMSMGAPSPFSVLFLIDKKTGKKFEYIIPDQYNGAIYYNEIGNENKQPVPEVSPQPAQKPIVNPDQPLIAVPTSDSPSGIRVNPEKVKEAIKVGTVITTVGVILQWIFTIIIAL